MSICSLALCNHFVTKAFFFLQNPIYMKLIFTLVPFLKSYFETIITCSKQQTDLGFEV